jgi:hypothetical protein
MAYGWGFHKQSFHPCEDGVLEDRIDEKGVIRQKDSAKPPLFIEQLPTMGLRDIKIRN